jgi:tetratricopeptide (TPR) repeat protein
MTWRGALACAVVAAGWPACQRHPPRPPPGPVVSTLLALAAEFGADGDATTRAFAQLEDIALRVDARHRRGHGELADDLNAVIFGELGFAREIESGATRFFQLPAVLHDRRGSCLGLGALYLAVAERLGVPLDGILLPGHFLVRTRGPKPRNVELLRRGEAMPDEWYRQKYGPWPGGGSAYDRPVTPTELEAIHWYNRGNDLRQAGELAAAEQALARAARAFPGFAEAHASLGALRQLRGALAEAALAYQQAARAWPGLPGLAENVELLQRQLAAGYLPPAGSALRQK